MQNVYKNNEVYNLERKHKVLIVFDDMITDMVSKKNLNQSVTGLFTRRRKLNISTVFITQSYFHVPQNFRLNSTYYFI